MKKLLTAALMLGFASFASAQTPTTTAPTTTTTTTTTTAPKMEKKHRMHKAEKAADAAGAATGATTQAPVQDKMKKAEGAHKDGMKGEHKKRTLAEEQANAAKAAARDKVIAKDAAGNDIHLGPNGGQYYINKEGTKTYLKGAAKMKTN